MARTGAGAIHARLSALSPNLRGAIWLVVGTALFASNDAFIKHLGREITPLQIAFIRYLLGIVLLAPVFHHFGWGNLKTRRFPLHAWRVCIACTAQLLIYYAIIHMPLATATAISYSRPIFQTVLAVIFLHELVSGRRWTATAVGFAGVLIMVRPGAAGFDPWSLAAVASALLFGYSIILIRFMSTTEPTPRILFYYHLGGALIFVGPAIWTWVDPTPLQWALLLAAGALTTAAMWCVVRAYAIAETSFVGPVEYIRLIYAAAIGFVFFAEVPDVYTVIGAAIIVTSSLYLARGGPSPRRSGFGRAGGRGGMAG